MEQELNLYRDEHFGNPQLEKMNNFYMNMPGGLYRPDNNHDSAAIAYPQLFNELKCWFDAPREIWPSDLANCINSLQMKCEIQKEVDVFLAENSRIADWWKDWIGKFPNKLNPTQKSIIEKQIIRPVYIALRENFSQEQLII